MKPGIGGAMKPGGIGGIPPYMGAPNIIGAYCGMNFIGIIGMDYLKMSGTAFFGLGSGIS